MQKCYNCADKSQKMKIINIVLTLIIITLAVFLVKTLNDPIQFDKERTKRMELVKRKMIYIRTLQLAHNDVHNKFASTFDSLRIFVENDSFNVIKMIGDPDALNATVTYQKFKTSVRDSLMNKSFDLKMLDQIPIVEGETFKMETDVITKGKFDVPVMLLEATFPQILKGLNEDFIDVNKTMTIGSLNEPVYNGNWEGK
jgi:hypothetical protein